MHIGSSRTLAWRCPRAKRLWSESQAAGSDSGAKKLWLLLLHGCTFWVRLHAHVTLAAAGARAAGGHWPHSPAPPSHTETLWVTASGGPGSQGGLSCRGTLHLAARRAPSPAEWVSNVSLWVKIRFTSGPGTVPVSWPGRATVRSPGGFPVTGDALQRTLSRDRVTRGPHTCGPASHGACVEGRWSPPRGPASASAC